MFLGIIFFLELTAGILAFVFKDWIKDQLNFFINNNIRAYRDDIDLQNLIDFTQDYVSVSLNTHFPTQDDVLALNYKSYVNGKFHITQCKYVHNSEIHKCRHVE